MSALTYALVGKGTNEVMLLEVQPFPELLLLTQFHLDAA